jgi:hypothetical protein
VCTSVICKEKWKYDSGVNVAIWFEFPLGEQRMLDYDTGEIRKIQKKTKLHSNLMKKALTTRVVVGVASARRRARQIENRFGGCAFPSSGGGEHELLAGVGVLEAEAALGADKEAVFGREAT